MTKRADHITYTLDDLDRALAKVALLIRARGAHGLIYLPLFERLECEREQLADLDSRLDLAIKRGGNLSNQWKAATP